MILQQPQTIALTAGLGKSISCNIKYKKTLPNTIGGNSFGGKIVKLILKEQIKKRIGEK